jgi:hypothetical protein
MDSMRVAIKFVIIQLARQVRGVPKNTRSKYSRRIVPIRRSTNGCESSARDRFHFLDLQHAQVCEPAVKTKELDRDP